MSLGDSKTSPRDEKKGGEGMPETWVHRYCYRDKSGQVVVVSKTVKRPRRPGRPGQGLRAGEGLIAVDGSDSDAGNVVFLKPECLVDTMPYLTVREHYHDFKRAGDVLVNMDRLREQSCNL